VSAPFAAGAQFGGMPGLPGGPPGQVPGGGGRPPPGPPACQELLELRDQTQKHGLAIQKGNERKATVQDACKLFKTILAAETQFIRRLEDNSRICGVPPDAIKRDITACRNRHTCESEPQLSWISPSNHDTSQHGPRRGPHLRLCPLTRRDASNTHLFDGGQTSPCRRALLVATQWPITSSHTDPNTNGCSADAANGINATPASSALGAPMGLPNLVAREDSNFQQNRYERPELRARSATNGACGRIFQCCSFGHIVTRLAWRAGPNVRTCEAVTTLD
jgi:hypothetical protein